MIDTANMRVSSTLYPLFLTVVTIYSTANVR